MNMFRGSRPIPFHPWLFGVIALFGLTSCATTRLAEGDQVSNTEAVDIGYGTVDKRHLTGSVATVRSEDMRGIQPQTLIELLGLPAARPVPASRAGRMTEHPASARR